ncbi:hypothetical protein LJC68_00830 [Bacteroidales bacterium OttesenSCG-928-B11]|nr:hypothetical protein [Bacteroidales bacterium OttesenSCG-928-E04]MDL2308507.1 hypothetical protein [Bacteroidales bacterium OttesenSCG-928-C03]MDL2311408.1 hypothetical protein [Bacteroidales bacterium OttesenSCG-928-B11]MDL2325804.1 hypothetical protein [Bacteroidales bacterium OttesenSCG-928-A14]
MKNTALKHQNSNSNIPLLTRNCQSKMLLFLALLLAMSSAFSQKRYYYRSSGDSTTRVLYEETIPIDKKSYLYIDYHKGDTTLVKKTKPVSRELLAEDLKVMYEKLDRIDPSIPIITGMTGYPIMDKILENNAHYPVKKLDLQKLFDVARANLNTCMKFQSFDKPSPKHPQSFNTTAEYRKNCGWFAPNEAIKYIDGKYYTKRQCFFQTSSFCCCNKPNLHIVAINGVATSEAFKNNITTREKILFSTLWDPVHRKFYSNDINHVSKDGRNHFLMQDEYEYNRMAKSRVPFCHEQIEYNALDVDYPVIWYHEEARILYMHIPIDGYYLYHFYDEEQGKSNMPENKAFVDSLVNKIKLFSDKPIEKMVVDLRFHSSRDGFETNLTKLLSAIIDEPLHRKRDVYIRNTPEAIALVEQQSFFKPIEGNHTKEVFGTSYLRYSELSDTIHPATNSLNYKGEIYFFVDQSINSYDLCFLTNISSDSRINIWGVPNGSFLNAYIYPSHTIELPNTGLAFRCSPYIIFPANIEDFYNGGISKRIFLTIEQERLFRSHKGHLFNFEFLKVNDPYFQSLIND